LEEVAVEEQLEPYVKEGQQRELNQKEWRVIPPKEEFFSCVCPCLSCVSGLSGTGFTFFPILKNTLMSINEENNYQSMSRCRFNGECCKIATHQKNNIYDVIISPK
jgi:hypothetical protein